MQKFLSREDYMLLGIFKKQSEDNLGFLHSSVGKEPACNAGDAGSIPGSGKSPADGIGYTHSSILDFPLWLAGKESTHNAGDLSSISGLGEIPCRRERLPRPEYSGLDNSRGYTVHGVKRMDKTE